MLTDDNKALILRKINEGIQDYVVLANLVFNREDLTGRAKEAKAVRDFLISTGFSKKQEKPKDFYLNGLLIMNILQSIFHLLGIDLKYLGIENQK